MFLQQEQKLALKGIIEEDLPKHQQGGHGNQSEEQIHSSDHCAEPERENGKDILLVYNRKL